LKALEIADNQTKSFLLDSFSDNTVDPETKIKTVVDIYDRLDMQGIVNAEIMHYFNKSMNFLDILDVEKHRKDELFVLSKKLIRRDY